MVTIMSMLIYRVYADVGLRTKFADIVLANLDIGKSYSLRDIRGLSYIVMNSGTEPTEIEIYTESPQKEKLKEGYEAIPDPSWVKVFPKTVKLNPQEEAICDIILTIPNDKNLIGKHYQVSIIAKTVPPEGGTFYLGASLENRLRFSIGVGTPESMREEKKRMIKLELDFELFPRNLFLDDIIIGKMINIRKEKGTTLRLINKTNKHITFKFQSIHWKEGFKHNPEYTPAEPQFITINPKIVKVEPDSIKPLNIFIRFPKDQSYSGGKFVFLIKGEVLGYGVPLEVYSQVYVTTK